MCLLKSLVLVCAEFIIFPSIARHKRTAIADYIDLFLIHAPFGGTDHRLSVYKALEEARKAGKIRSVGVSN